MEHLREAATFRNSRRARWARAVARAYRAQLAQRLDALAVRIDPGRAQQLGAGLALLIDGMDVNAAHLGADGPAASGQALADALIAAARR